MKLAIVGSRSYNDYKQMVSVLQDYDFDTVISGGAKGADSLASTYAREHGKNLIVFAPEWGKYGKRAGYLRNEQIVSAADKVIAFWDGISKGTKHTIELSYKKGKLLRVVYFNQEGFTIQ